MSILNEPQGADETASYEDEVPVRTKKPGNVVVKWLTTTDHKTIGTLYLVTSFAFFCIGGVMALFMRAELARPGTQFMSNEQFNQAFTMHGTIMLLMFATPLFAGFANWIMPLQIGAPDVAFPRLNMFAYWLYLFGSLIAVGGFLTPGGAADFGWFAYSPLSNAIHSPGVGADMWIMGLAFTFLIAVPTGVKFFNWLGTMWKGSLSFETPMLWVIGFLVTFTFGGLTGVILASPPLDFHVSDSYFVVAHFHYVIFGTVVFAMFAGFHFWWPKFTGKMLDERLGKICFWTLFFGFHGTFLVQHWLGAEGMPRRYADYLAADGFTTLNTISTISSFLLGLSVLPFFYNVWKTAKYGKKVEVDDPWGYGRSLEWATSCPPPRHNFLTLPRIRSESPAFDLHHPEIAALDQLENQGSLESDKALAGNKEAGK
ncbi:cytochrome ubiquinol oxidase subunit I [Streptomyces albus subsp. albus]|nr:cytochrome ubiquinol oxidase subunit I [Streptomyces albus subsp. albus]